MCGYLLAYLRPTKLVPDESLVLAMATLYTYEDIASLLVAAASFLQACIKKDKSYYAVNTVTP